MPTMYAVQETYMTPKDTIFCLAIYRLSSSSAFYSDFKKYFLVSVKLPKGGPTLYRG